MISFLPRAEGLLLDLRKLFSAYGYTKFSMGTLEEYELYADQRNFLNADGIITFHDARGRLMALKPDVTLSIVKNSRIDAGGERYYYSESVFRLQRNGEYREIPQLGIENIGHSDEYTNFEVILLALRALEASERNFTLELNHLGLVEELFSSRGVARDFLPMALDAMSHKNSKALFDLLLSLGVDIDTARPLSKIAKLSGDVRAVISSLSDLGLLSEKTEVFCKELLVLYDEFSTLGLSDKIKLDMSVVNSVDYYNSFIFHGYIEGAPRSVLSGGRYDRLMRKLGRDTDAIGFALYMDEYSRALQGADEPDVDVLLIYDKACPTKAIRECTEDLQNQDLRFSVRPSEPTDLRYKKLIRLDKDGKEANSIC